MLYRNYTIAALLTAAAIVYLSLYPFEWRTDFPPWGALTQLARTAHEWPQSHGDFLANVTLYLPWGFFAGLALTRRMPAIVRIAIATVFGALLSFTMELAQFDVVGRFTDMRDIYANTTGSLLGAIVAVMAGGDMRVELPHGINLEPFPVFLLVGFLAVRLYPYVPVIDLHKYLQAIRPLLNVSSLPKAELFIRTALWLLIAYLGEILSGKRAAILTFILIAGLVFAGRIAIADATLSAPDVLGAMTAFALWFLMLRFLPGRVALLALFFAAALVLERLNPNPRGFDWIPFAGMMHGTIEGAILSFLSKFFFYGGLIWLLNEAGLRLWRATVAVVILVFFCSVIERYIPGRSAEITDTVMAILIGVTIRLMNPRRRGEPQPA